MSATKVSALDQLLFDLFVTALEGGINYWSSCQEYHWIKESHKDRTTFGPGAGEDTTGFNALIAEEDGDDQVPHTIDRKVMAKGYRLATTTWRDRLAWSTGKPPLVVGPDTDWDFDAGDADMIVQLGLFEDVRYG
jgi:hypothetical protein